MPSSTFYSLFEDKFKMFNSLEYCSTYNNLEGDSLGGLGKRLVQIEKRNKRRGGFNETHSTCKNLN